jgi:hypothetical protein
LVSEAEPPSGTRVAPGRRAAGISQAYYFVVAAIALIFVLGGAIAMLLAIRKWILPVSGAEASEFFGPSTDSEDAGRSFLGGLAFAVPGALALTWHLRQARRREGRPVSTASWGHMLYLHLVAAVSLLITLGGVVAMQHSLRDSVLPICFETPSFEIPPESPTFDGEVSPIPPVVGLPEDVDPELLRSEEECYPSTSEALRSALDAGIVAAVAGGAWLWHLGRGRRALEPPEPIPEPVPES